MEERAKGRQRLIEYLSKVALEEGISAQTEADELATRAMDIVDPPPPDSTEVDLTYMYNPPRAAAGTKRPLAPGELARVIAEESTAHRQRLKENDKKYHRPDPDMDRIVLG